MSARPLTVPDACLAFVAGFLLVAQIDAMSAQALGRVVIGAFFIGAAVLLAYAAGWYDGKQRKDDAP